VASPCPGVDKPPEGHSFLSVENQSLAMEAEGRLRELVDKTVKKWFSWRSEATMRSAERRPYPGFCRQAKS